MRYPSKIKAGMTVGLVSPSSPITPEREKACIEKLEQMGFKVKAADNISVNLGGFMAGSGKTRGEWINRMFADPEVDLVWCVRGGDSGSRAWPYLDVETIRKHPKPFIGYSDITTFHLVMNQMCDFVTFHGPMVSSNVLEDFDPETEASFFQAVNAEGTYTFANPEGFDIKCMHGGKASGILTGGNLTLLAASLGTPYEVDTKDKILFLEEVHGQVDSTERLVMQLINSGKLRDCAGVILGQFTDCINQVDATYDMIALFEDILSDLGKPILYNVQSGHGFPMMTLPMGAMCSLDADRREITFAVER